MMTRLAVSAMLAVSCAQLCFAQLDLTSLQTNSVRRGSVPQFIRTAIDSVDLTIEVNRGIVVTKAAIKLTPYTYSYNYQTKSCVPTTSSFDSLESQVYFKLPRNSAITDLYLWVGQERVRGFLQEKYLAAAQYESIVKRRMDPSLVQYDGNGNYSLKIFPLSSGVSRIVELEFAQSLENGNGFSSALPIKFSPMTESIISNYGCSNNGLIPYEKTLGKLTISARSLDGARYTISSEELGKIAVDNTLRTVTRDNLKALSAGVLTLKPATVSSDPRPWGGYRNGSAYFGVNLKFGPDDLGEIPNERNILIDLATSTYADQAKKLAILALKSYLQAPFTGNVILVTSKGVLRPVFSSAVTFTHANLEKAFGAINSYADYENRSTAFSPLAYAATRLTSSSAALFVFSDQPWNYTADESQFKASQLVARRIQLYAFTNNKSLQTIARMTGGLPLADIGTDPNSFLINEIDTRTGAVATRIEMPPLIVPNGSPSGLAVQAAGVSVQDLTVISDLENDVAELRVSGRNVTDGRIQLTITGTWSGRSLKKTIAFDIPSSGVASEKGSSMWAFQNSEALREANQYANRAKIFELGMNHHVVNSNTSLIALEPGMTLWTKEASVTGTKKNPAALRFSKSAFSVTIGNQVQFRIKVKADLRNTKIVIYNLRGEIVATVIATGTGEELFAALDSKVLGKGSFIAVVMLPDGKIAERFSILR